MSPAILPASRIWWIQACRETSVASGRVCSAAERSSVATWSAARVLAHSGSVGRGPHVSHGGKGTAASRSLPAAVFSQAG